MPSVDIKTQIVIDEDRARVAAFSANPDNAPRWYVNIRSVEWKTRPPVAVGSQLAFVAQFMGKRLEYTYEVSEYEPGERLVMRTAEGPFPMETTYLWEDVVHNDRASATLMTLRNRGRPSGFSALVVPLMRFMMRRANRKDLALLKEILEQSESSG